MIVFTILLERDFAYFSKNDFINKCLFYIYFISKCSFQKDLISDYVSECFHDILIKLSDCFHNIIYEFVVFYL